ncbi:MAG: pyridoxal 5'-phosphate synthase glutaminase subunit PdxT [Actinomycetota bacterium]
MKIGVLALQGAFREHVEALDALGADPIPVRRPEHLDAVDAIVLPGGESTTIDKLLGTSGLREPLAERIGAGLPVFATCAGLILCAREVVDGRPDQRSFGCLDLTVRRNGYGSQRDSFEARLPVAGLVGGPFRAVFIRAPVVERIGPAVEVLAEHAGTPVLGRAGAVWFASFHPELADDLRVHQRFLSEVG